MKILNQAGKTVLIFDKNGQEEELMGRFLVKSGQIVEVQTDLIFKAKKCNGKVWVKGVVEKGGRLEFRGKIKIEKGAELSDGYLKQEILLVEPGGVGIAVPELEIEANEVRASHAASVSCINEEQKFYLQSRGWSEKKAKNELIEAFLAN
jgi:Fe-S cluster assembly protein SufD